jgi:hypothetical protein
VRNSQITPVNQFFGAPTNNCKPARLCEVDLEAASDDEIATSYPGLFASQNDNGKR